MRLLVPPLILALALVLALVAGGGPVGARPDLVIVNDSEVGTLDPQRMSDLQDLRLGGALYEGLYRLDAESGAPRPALAASHAVSPDGLEHRFTLRPDRRWSDGSPVTAHDLAWSWGRAILPDTAADYTGLFLSIRGAQAFFDWRRDALADHAASRAGDVAAAEALWAETEARLARDVGLEVVDARTLVVRLARPVAYLSDLLAFPVFFPCHRPTVEDWPAEDRAGWAEGRVPPLARRRALRLDPATGRVAVDRGWTRPGRLVGNGPYVLESWRYKRDLRLRVNEAWPEHASVDCRRIELRVVEDPSTAVLAAAAGHADWLVSVGAEYRAELARARDDVHVLPAFAIDFWSFNCRPTLANGDANPFADARVRRAFVTATDRERLVAQVTSLGEPPVTTLVPAGACPGYASPEGLGFDPRAARASLDEAGWRDRDGDGRREDETGAPFPVVELLHATNRPADAWMGLALEAEWERILGVEVVLVARESKAFRADRRAGDFMIAHGTWYGDYGDPTTFLELCRTGDGNNDRGFSDPRVDSMLDAAARELDPARRLAILADCERLLFTECLPMLVMHRIARVQMWDPTRILGLEGGPRTVQHLHEIRRAEPDS